MSPVLDTHIWIWWLLGQDDLPRRQHETLDEIATVEPPLLPAVCMWEAQMLQAKGRLDLRAPFRRWLRDATHPSVVRIAPLTADVVIAVDQLPGSFHGDPADRLIVATARALDMPLATHDQRIRRSRVVRLWKP